MKKDLVLFLLFLGSVFSAEFTVINDGIKGMAMIEEGFDSISVPQKYKQRNITEISNMEGEEYRINSALIFDKNLLLAEIKEEKGMISEIFIFAPEFETQKGIKVGMSLRDVCKIYPNAQIKYTYISEMFYVMIDDNIQAIIDGGSYIGKKAKLTSSDSVNIFLKEMGQNAKIVKIRVF